MHFSTTFEMTCPFQNMNHKVSIEFLQSQTNTGETKF